MRESNEMPMNEVVRPEWNVCAIDSCEKEMRAGVLVLAQTKGCYVQFCTDGNVMALRIQHRGSDDDDEVIDGMHSVAHRLVRLLWAALVQLADCSSTALAFGSGLFCGGLAACTIRTIVF